MKHFLKILAAVSLMVMAATAARAEFYMGGSLGNTVMDPTVAEDSISQWNTALYGAGTDCETLGCYSEFGYTEGAKFFAGYRVNPYFAAEGFVAYLGTFDSYANDGFGVDSYATADVSTLGVAAVGLIPVSDGVSLLAKIGAHSWSVDGTINLWDAVEGAGVLGSYEESGTDLMGGLGVQFDFGAHFAMRMELEYFEAKTAFTNFGVGFASIGAMYKF